jgi:hypothetical protein
MRLANSKASLVISMKHHRVLLFTKKLQLHMCCTALPSIKNVTASALQHAVQHIATTAAESP